MALEMWRADWSFGLPTPRPAGHSEVAIGSEVGLESSIARALEGRRTNGASGVVFLHFYNPDCPCSRFNLEHVRGLTARHGDEVDFVLVVESDDEKQAARASQRVEPGLPWVDDRHGAAADHYGVYSTPLAVIVDRKGRLAFRGNYASARYCTDPAQEYARIALEALLDGDADRASAPTRDPYGCPLPSDQIEAANTRSTTAFRAP